MPAATENTERFFDARAFAGNHAACELGRGAGDASHVGVGQLHSFGMRNILHGRRARQRGRGRVVQAVRAAQRLLDDQHRTSGGNLVGRRRVRLGEIVRDGTNLVDRQLSEGSGKRNKIHFSYVGASFGK
jgi:hypothetical protein